MTSPRPPTSGYADQTKAKGMSHPMNVTSPVPEITVWINYPFRPVNNLRSAYSFPHSDSGSISHRAYRGKHIPSPRPYSVTWSEVQIPFLPNLYTISSMV